MTNLFRLPYLLAARLPSDIRSTRTSQGCREFRSSRTLSGRSCPLAGNTSSPAIEFTAQATLNRVDEGAEPSPTGSPTSTGNPSPTSPSVVDPSATGDPSVTQSPTSGSPTPGQEP